VIHVALADKGLKVGVEPNAVRWVHVYHLYLPAQALIVQERIYDQQRVTEDHAVDLLIPILIGFKHLISDRTLRVAEQLRQCELLCTFVLLVPL
jgi:hypothetical protein